MTGEGCGNDNKNSTAEKKKKKSSQNDEHGKESSHKKKSSKAKGDDLDKSSVHKKKSKETKSADMDKSGHRKKKKKEEEKEKDEAKPVELDKSTHKKKKSKEGESLDKGSTHKRKTKTKDDDLDKSSKHTPRHSETGSKEKTKSESLDKSSSHDKKAKESDSLDKSSRHKKKSKDMDKSSHKKHRSKLMSSSTEPSSETASDPSLSASERTSSVSGPEKEDKDPLATKSSHKRGKKSEKDGKDALSSNSTHKRGKKSEKEGKDALASSSTHKRGKKSEKDEKDALAATSTHRRGKKSEVLKSIDEESPEITPPPVEHHDHPRRGKKKEILRESAAIKGDSSDSKDVVPSSTSNKNDKEVTKNDKRDDKTGTNVAMDASKGAQKVRFPADDDDASDTSEDDSSVASFGEEGDEHCAPSSRGTRGPPGVFLTRGNSKNLGRILASDASEDDIFAALEAEADQLKEEINKPRRGLTRSKSQRSSSFDKKHKGLADPAQSDEPPKWQPGQEIKPMAAEDLRAMLNMKSPPKRTQTWRDSRWFRDDVVPEMPIALAVNAVPTSDESGKLVTRPNGTVKMLRPDQCEDMKLYSALRRSQVKDALRQSLSATIH